MMAFARPSETFAPFRVGPMPPPVPSWPWQPAQVALKMVWPLVALPSATGAPESFGIPGFAGCVNASARTIPTTTTNSVTGSATRRARDEGGEACGESSVTAGATLPMPFRIVAPAVHVSSEGARDRELEGAVHRLDGVAGARDPHDLGAVCQGEGGGDRAARRAADGGHRGVRDAERRHERQVDLVAADARAHQGHRVRG